MRIIKLEASNFKRIKAISIVPTGAATIVGGANAQGKSSVLDAISAALGGKSEVPSEPLRRGADRGHVVLDLDDIVVKRTFSEGGTQLTVTSKDGAKYSSPQSMLDELVGSLSFDPLRFSRMDPKEQVATLRALAGVDFTALDAERAKVFAERTDTTREVKRLRALLDAAPDHPDAPLKEVSVGELASELASRREVNRVRRTDEATLDDMRRHAGDLSDRIAVLHEQLVAAQAELSALTEKGKALAARVATLPVADEDSVVAQMASAEAINTKARARLARAKIADELGQAGAAEGHATKRLEEIDALKRELLAKAKFNVAGLAFDEQGVTLNGVPLKQASSAEQIRLSVAIGIAMNPKLRVLLIKDGSLLDEAGLAAVAKQAADSGAQLWIEKVSDTGRGCTVVIEDGSVRGAEARINRETGTFDNVVDAEFDEGIVSTSGKANFRARGR